MSIASRSSCSQWPEQGPIVVLGRGHSGTRFLAEALQRQGVFIGANLNPMFDAEAWAPVIQEVVLGIYPRYDLLVDGDIWHRKVEETAAAFLREGYTGGPWGWKIGITAFIIPLLARVFPNLRIIHLVRDGRDVMLSRLSRVIRMAIRPFNRKIILGDADAQSWFGIPITKRSINRYRNEFEMLTWVQFVAAARRYGQPLGPQRYVELRYEDMCLDPVPSVGKVFEFAGLKMTASVADFLKANAQTDRISKWKALPPRKIAGAISIGKLLLDELGYTEPAEVSPVDATAESPRASCRASGPRRRDDPHTGAAAGFYGRARRLVSWVQSRS